jgi:hypothetical protein
MLMKTLLAVVAALAITAPAALADDLGFGWQDSAPVNAQQGDVSHDSGKTDTKNFYQQETNPANSYGVQGGRVQQPVHKSSQTVHGGIQDNLPDLPEVTSGSVVPGGGFAPGSLAYMVEHHTGVGGALPKTTLDSFVARSGYNDFIYGDEGTEGPPPYSSFGTIGSGGVQATTGHSGGGLPSAWY